MKNNNRRCYGDFFSNMSFQKYLITVVFIVLSQQLRRPIDNAPLTTAFERLKITIEDFTDMSVKPAPRHLTYHCMLFFLSNKPSF